MPENTPSLPRQRGGQDGLHPTVSNIVPSISPGFTTDNVAKLGMSSLDYSLNFLAKRERML
jgi:hypothetical protein